MLANFMPKLIQELELTKETLASEVPGTYSLPLEGGLTIDMTDIPDGFILKSNIATYPPKDKEELFLTQAMMGNLFGQGTKGAILGINPEGTALTLTRIVDFPVEYKEFRDFLEDFINVMDFWREEIQNPTPLK
jgi:hypothetical protein